VSYEVPEPLMQCQLAQCFAPAHWQPILTRRDAGN
jgi:hypothetical protein